MTPSAWDFTLLTDATLRALDPRLPDTERTAARDAMTRNPDYTIGVLTQIIEDYHTRAENTAGRPAGSSVDRLRSRLLELNDDAVWAVALTSGTESEQATFTILDPTRPADEATPPPPAPDPLPAECGHPTTTGRCALRAGHPAGPGLPGENGHIAGETS